MLNNLNVKTNERFSEERYPAIAKEVADLQIALARTRDLYKIEMVTSFLKYHSVTSEWLKGNGKVVDVLRSASTGISNLESLFVSARNNPEFTADLEKYIALKLADRPFVATEESTLPT